MERNGALTNLEIDPALAGSRLLATLSEADQHRLSPALSLVEAVRGDELIAAGESSDWVFMPCDGAVVSIGVTASPGRVTEIALVGAEGIAGSFLAPAAPAYSRAVVLCGGRFVRVSRTQLHTAAAQSPTLCEALARYADCYLAELTQTVACNAAHALPLRMARWMLCMGDRTGPDGMGLTHDYLANLLCVGRTYVTRAATRLQRDGVIRYRRGRVDIADSTLLQAAACGCRDAIAAHFERVLPGVYATR